MSRLHTIFLGAACLLLLAPAIALASGPPLPPGGLFRAPPTPTPAPLNEHPAPQAPVVDTRLPEPAVDESQLYLPFISAPAPAMLLAAPVTAGAMVTGSALATGNFTHEDPLAAAFVYQLQPGDTLSDLAIEFGRDLRTMFCAFGPDGKSIDQLQAGDSVVVPALGDLCHRVKAGEKLDKIAAWYGVEASDLLAVPENRLDVASDVRAGQYLLIPEARSRYRDPAEVNLPRAEGDGWRYGSGKFIWPIAPDRVWISQGFRHGKHMALDLATRAGTQVHAADTGKVIKVGWNDNGYGYRIVIDHGIDYVTLYAHLSEYYVQEGDIVQQGDVIGVVGSTGNSTGPHLHFEVRDYGYLIDPLLVLPGGDAE